MPDYYNTVTVTDAGERICPAMIGNCRGPSCMAWRWAPESTPRRVFVECDDPRATIEPERPLAVLDDWIWCPFDFDPAGWIEPEEQFEARRRGYCGQAPLNQEPRHA